jgi:hypothetical protein
MDKLCFFRYYGQKTTLERVRIEKKDVLKLKPVVDFESRSRKKEFRLIIVKRLEGRPADNRQC